jgi:hypothetical protein
MVWYDANTILVIILHHIAIWPQYISRKTETRR